VRLSTAFSVITGEEEGVCSPGICKRMVLNGVMSLAVEELFEAASVFKGKDGSKVPTSPHAQGQKNKHLGTGDKFGF